MSPFVSRTLQSVMLTYVPGNVVNAFIRKPSWSVSINVKSKASSPNEHLNSAFKELSPCLLIYILSDESIYNSYCCDSN